MKITLLENQSLLDIALRHYGDARAALDIAFHNDIDIGEPLKGGDTLILPKSEYIDKEVLRAYRAKNIVPACGPYEKIKKTTSIEPQELNKMDVRIEILEKDILPNIYRVFELESVINRIQEKKSDKTALEGTQKDLSEFKDQMDSLHRRAQEKLKALSDDIEKKLKALCDELEKLKALCDEIENLKAQSDEIDKLKALCDELEKLKALCDEIKKIKAPSDEIDKLKTDLNDRRYHLYSHRESDGKDMDPGEYKSALTFELKANDFMKPRPCKDYWSSLVTARADYDLKATVAFQISVCFEGVFFCRSTPAGHSSAPESSRWERWRKVL